MKVLLNIPSLQVDDDQIVKLANILDGKISKRRATRNEAKDYIWQAGADWNQAIEDDWVAKFGTDTVEDDDLI
jgi:hypothetical protein